MSAQTTSWILELVDHISSPMKHVMTTTNQAGKSVDKLGTDLKSLGNIPGKILGTLGIGFGMFQMVNMMQQGIEKAHELHLAQAKIEANLQSTEGKAGLTSAALSEMAGTLSSKILAGRADITDMQSQLLTFPSITKDVFGRSMGLVADIAAQTGHELRETAIMYGKALSDPAKGLQLMRRYGVMFTDQEKEKIKKLEESGKLIEAQKAMMDAIASSGYAGVAEKLFNATPMAKYNKMVGSIKMTIGELGIKIQDKLAPHLETLASHFKSVVKGTIDMGKWMYHHQTTVLTFAGAIGLIGLALNAVAIKTKLMAYWEGIMMIKTALATTGIYLQLGAMYAWDAITSILPTKLALVTFATSVWNAVLAVNPIVMVVAGIGLLIGAIVLCYAKFGWFRGIILGTWEVIKGFGGIIKDYVIDRIQGILSGLGGLAKAIGQLFKGNFKEAWETAKQAGADLVGISAGKHALENAKNVGKKVGEAYQKGVKEVAEEDKKKAAEKKAEESKKAGSAVVKPKTGDTNLAKNGTSPVIIPKKLHGGGDDGSGGTGGSLSGSGGGVGGVKSITQKIDIKNYFTVSEGSNVEAIAERVVRVINDRLRDATVALQ